jgi:putative ABC transport system permease protein
LKPLDPRLYMIPALFQVVLRSFYRRKFFFLLNLAGLSIGFAAYFFLFLTTTAEEQYDQFHDNKERIVRVKASRYHKNILSREMAAACYAAGPDITDAFAEVERYVRMVPAISLLRHDDNWFKTEKAAYVSEDFFRIFSFPLVKGSDSLALTRPHTLVLSESFAKKVFGEADPVGKVVNYKGRFDYEVTGVFADMPPNSHLDLDLILSFESYKKIVNKMVEEEPWRWDGIFTYLLLTPGSSVQALEDKLSLLVEEKSGEWLRNTDQHLELSLQPLTTIHLTSNFSDEWKTNGDGKLVLYLKLIAISILLLAWINYISLATAKSLERAREVGIRKVMGSNRMQLIIHFLAESILLTVVALTVALVIIALAGLYWPEYSIRSDQLKLLSLQHWFYLALAIFGGGVAAGLYPALVLSGFNPVIVLKGTFGSTAKGVGVRKMLVTIQFALSLILMIWIYSAGKQIQHVRNQVLGFDKNMKLVVRDSEVYDSLFDRRVSAFKAEVVRLPGIDKMTYVEALPGEKIRGYSNSVRRIKADTSDVSAFSFIRVDEHFADVLGMSLAAGRFFTETSVRRKEVVVNESACKQLGFTNPEDAVQEEIFFRDDTVRIIGVLHDFYFHAPREALLPLIFQYDPRLGYNYILSIQGGHAQDLIHEVGNLFSEIFPGQPFQYKFLDEHYNRQYAADLQFEKTLSFFTGLSVWVTCLGLIGLSAYTVTIRKREIGIRKVLGSSSGEVLALFWKEYFWLLGAACIIAMPASFYILDSWLADFSLRMEITIWLFILPTVSLLILMLATVAYQTVRAALANPVESIRHE